jgi:hypothetical protein
MPRHLDAYDMDDAAERAEPQDVTCNRCQEDGLHWQRVTAADGRSERSVLCDDRMRPHVCKPSADDFDAI